MTVILMFWHLLIEIENHITLQVQINEGITMAENKYYKTYLYNSKSGIDFTIKPNLQVNYSTIGYFETLSSMSPYL